jgi:hypothetical protein
MSAQGEEPRRPTAVAWVRHPNETAPLGAAVTVHLATAADGLSCRRIYDGRLREASERLCRVG